MQAEEVQHQAQLIQLGSIYMQWVHSGIWSLKIIIFWKSKALSTTTHTSLASVSPHFIIVITVFIMSKKNIRKYRMTTIINSIIHTPQMLVVMLVRKKEDPQNIESIKRCTSSSTEPKDYIKEIQFKALIWDQMRSQGMDPEELYWPSVAMAMSAAAQTNPGWLKQKYSGVL